MTTEELSKNLILNKIDLLYIIKDAKEQIDIITRNLNDFFNQSFGLIELADFVLDDKKTFYLEDKEFDLQEKGGLIEMMESRDFI